MLPLPVLASALMAALRAELLLAVVADVDVEFDAAFFELFVAAVAVPAGVFEVWVPEAPPPDVDT